MGTGNMPKKHFRQALIPGSRLHWYEIVRVLGQGGFGITYFARDSNLDQPVAIKEYLPVDIARRAEDGAVEPRTEGDLESFQQGMARFLAEAKTLNRFDHPNIVRVHSVFEANDTAYMVMRYEDGECLNDVLDREGTLAQAQIIEIVKPLLHGLAQIHAAGYIHRDVQPANIYLRRDGSPVLIDFGAARESAGKPRTMTILVAPGYAPIEQYYAHGQEQGPWTDLYGLGATLYRAIAGVPPLDAIERSRGILGSTRDILVPAVVVGHGRYSDELLRAIDHALMFNERDRPQSAAAWAAELEGAHAAVVPSLNSGDGPRMPVAPAAEPPLAPASRGGWRHFATLAALIVLLGAALVWRFGDFRQTREPSAGHARSQQLVPDKAPASAPANATPSNTDAAASSVATTGVGPSAAATPSDEPIVERATAPATASATAATAPAAMDAVQDVGPEDAAGDKGDALAERFAGRIAAESTRIATLEQQLRDLEKQREHTESQIKAVALSTPARVERAAEPAAVRPAPGARLAAVEAQQAPPSPAPSATSVSPDRPALEQARLLAYQGDFVGARRLLESPAAAGVAEAQYLLGNLLIDGRGGTPETEAALAWYLKAAQQGLRDAQIAVARTYAPGNGNRFHEPFLAYTWFVVAEQNGAFDVAAERDQASRLLQPEQLPQALALAHALRGQSTDIRAAGPGDVR